MWLVKPIDSYAIWHLLQLFADNTYFPLTGAVSSSAADVTMAPSQRHVSWLRVCDVCSLGVPMMKRCRCGGPLYCSSECRDQAWTAHKEVCTHAQLACLVFGVTGVKIKVCSCREARYCSPECQRQAWPDHKAVCSFIPRGAA